MSPACEASYISWYASHSSTILPHMYLKQLRFIFGYFTLPEFRQLISLSPFHVSSLHFSSFWIRTLDFFFFLWKVDLFIKLSNTITFTKCNRISPKYTVSFQLPSLQMVLGQQIQRAVWSRISMPISYLSHIANAFVVMGNMSHRIWS